MTRNRLIGGGIVLLVTMAFGFNTFKDVTPEPREERISPTRSIVLNGREIRVAVADTPLLRERGLSGYSRLESDEGMLFVFEGDGRFGFWMKDMLFPIDILWLDAAGSIVHIENNVRPESYPSSFTPDSPARYVLELRAGSVKEYDIRIGQSANLEE